MTISDPTCCFELDVRIFEGQYQTHLLVDGMIQQQLALQSEGEIADWANQFLYTTGRELYIHLRAEGRAQRQETLALARKLSLQGLMIGITEQPAFCRRQNPQLQ